MIVIALFGVGALFERLRLYALVTAWWTWIVSASLFAISALLIVLDSSFSGCTFLVISVLWVLQLDSSRIRCAAVTRYTCASKTSQVVGGGWSFVLQGKAVARPPRFMESGAERNQLNWFKSGTTLYELQHLLRRRDLTLAGLPSLRSVTLGGWVATASHGTGGTLWTQTILRVRTEEGIELAPQDIDSDTVVASVKIAPVKDVLVTRIAFDVINANSIKRYFTEPSRLRALFITPSVITAFLWVDTSSQTQTSGSSCIPPWLWTICTWCRIDRSRWKRSMKLSDAHFFGPSPPSLGYMFMSQLYQNFEVYLHTSLTNDTIFLLCQKLQTCLHRGERCEIRCGMRRLCMDFAVRKSRQKTQLVFSTLHALFPTARVSLHRGKMQVDVSPMTMA